MPINLPNPFKKIKITSGQKDVRKILASHIKRHRIEHHNYGYQKRRSLRTLLELYNFNLPDYLIKKYGHQNQIHILDSGAGHLSMANSIKETMGKKAHVTTLNIITPKGTKKTREGNAPFDQRKEMHFYAEAIREYTHDKAKLVDKIKVSSAERMKNHGKYDVIMDFWGPMHYSEWGEIIFNNYLTHLKEGGVILTNEEFPPRAFWGTLTDKNTGKQFRIVTKEATPNATIHEMRVEWVD